MRRPSASQFLRNHYVEPSPSENSIMTNTVTNKYDPAKLPDTPEQALAMAETHETSARRARDHDLHGSARHLELVALLLRYYAATVSSDPQEKIT